MGEFSLEVVKSRMIPNLRDHGKPELWRLLKSTNKSWTGPDLGLQETYLANGPGLSFPWVAAPHLDEDSNSVYIRFNVVFSTGLSLPRVAASDLDEDSNSVCQCAPHLSCVLLRLNLMYLLLKDEWILEEPKQLCGSLCQLELRINW